MPPSINDEIVLPTHSYPPDTPQTPEEKKISFSNNCVNAAASVIPSLATGLSGSFLYKNHLPCALAIGVPSSIVPEAAEIVYNKIMIKRGLKEKRERTELSKMDKLATAVSVFVPFAFNIFFSTSFAWMFNGKAVSDLALGTSAFVFFSAGFNSLTCAMLNDLYKVKESLTYAGQLKAAKNITPDSSFVFFPDNPDKNIETIDFDTLKSDLSVRDNKKHSRLSSVNSVKSANLKSEAQI